MMPAPRLHTSPRSAKAPVIRSRSHAPPIGKAAILEADTVVFVLSPSDVAAGLIEARNARDTMSINAGSIPHAESA